VIEEKAGEAGTLYDIPSGLLMSGEQKLAAAVDKDGDVMMATSMVPQTEDKKEQKKAALFSAVAENNSDDESDASAEDLDSDDLEDEIQDNVGEILSMQHQQV
jgi:hypothetical protein